MSKAISHRYLKDRSGETYFPITHIDAVQGIDTESTENALTDMNDKISQMNDLITKANESILNQQKSIDDQKQIIDGQRKDIDEQLKTINNQKQTISNQKQDIDKNKELINYFDVAIANMVFDTGWVDFGIQAHMRNGAIADGFKCAIREVRVGNSLTPNSFTIRSIRLNISDITGKSMKIAELPVGFITNNQSFMARGQGYRHPLTIECKKDGSVTAFVHPEDQDKTNWIYQEFTWLE